MEMKIRIAPNFVYYYGKAETVAVKNPIFFEENYDVDLTLS